MTSSLKNIGNSFLSLIQTQFVPVRHRYYADKIARGPVAKKFGYTDKILRRGLLPRVKEDEERLPGPVYRPKNAWSKERVSAGQNDYIDILGGRRLKPFNVAYDVPSWLRGKKGNEIQLLLLKKKVFSRTRYQFENPTMWNNLNRRIIYLYKYLNRKTKTGISYKE